MSAMVVTELVPDRLRRSFTLDSLDRIEHGLCQLALVPAEAIPRRGDRVSKYGNAVGYERRSDTRDTLGVLLPVDGEAAAADRRQLGQQVVAVGDRVLGDRLQRMPCEILVDELGRRVGEQQLARGPGVCLALRAAV